MAALDNTRTHFGSLTSAGYIGSTFTSMFAATGSHDITRSNVISLSLSTRLGLVFATLTGVLRDWNDARSTRNALNRLSNAELNDIGLGRGDIDNVSRGIKFR